MNKEFLEIVGNGKPTGSVLKETIAVSVTMLISVEKLHHQIRLRILSCSRVSENHRGPDVPEERVPVGECLDGPARITSKELAPILSVKNGILQNACSTSRRMECQGDGVPKAGQKQAAADSRLFYKTKSGCRFGEKCSFAHRQVDEQPTKRSKKDGDKSAVAMLKKHESYDRTGKPVVCRDTSHERHGPVVCDSSNTRQLGCVFQDMEPPKSLSILQTSSDTRKPIRRVKFTKAVARHAYIRVQNPSLGLICPGEPHISVAPTLQNLRTGLRRRQSGKSDGPAKRRGSWPKVF